MTYGFYEKPKTEIRKCRDEKTEKRKKNKEEEKIKNKQWKKGNVNKTACFVSHNDHYFNLERCVRETQR